MPAPWVPQSGGGGDGKVFVDSSDSIAGFLAPKLAAGTGVTLTVLNPGGDEQVEIAAPLIDTNMVLVDIIDTVPGFLADKIEGSDTITIDIVGSPSERMVLNAVIPASVPLFAAYIVNPNFGAVAPDGSDEAPFELVSDAIAQAVSNGLSQLVILFYGVPAGTESITVPDNFILTIDCPGYAGAPFSGIVLGDGCVVTLLNARCTGVTPRVTVASPGNSGTLIWTNIDTENAGTTTDQVVGIDAPDYDLQLTNVGLLGNSTAHNVSMVGCGPHRFSGVGSLTCTRLQATDTLFYSGFGLAISGRAIFTNCDVSGSGPVITNPAAPVEVDSYTAKRFLDAGVTPSGGINVIELPPPSAGISPIEVVEDQNIEQVFLGGGNSFITRNGSGDPIECTFSDWNAGDILYVDFQVSTKSDDGLPLGQLVWPQYSLDGGTTWVFLSPQLGNSTGISGTLTQDSAAGFVSIALASNPLVQIGCFNSTGNITIDPAIGLVATLRCERFAAGAYTPTGITWHF